MPIDLSITWGLKAKTPQSTKRVSTSSTGKVLPLLAYVMPYHINIYVIPYHING